MYSIVVKFLEVSLCLFFSIKKFVFVYINMIKERPQNSGARYSTELCFDLNYKSKRNMRFL
jgi:hypothetical protein